MRKIQPINNNLLIKLDEVKEDKTAGGIIIPDTAKEKSQEGEVVAVPPDSDIGVSVGDRVMYKSFSGTEITFEGEKYLIVPSDDILAKFVEVDAI
ncbi:MAG: co-chaperone GroES [Deltaproteobacteria bacterium]|nr:co-chaperone GroES [Deltaproteobacteria bacterium]